MRQVSRARLRPEYPLYVPKLRLAYVAAPKNACTTLKMTLYRLRFEEDFYIVNLAGYDLYHVHHVFPTRHFNSGALEGIKVEDRFCVIRDPIDRFVSFYCNRILHHDDLVKAKSQVLAKRLSLKPDINELIAHLEAYMEISRQVRHHVLPQSVFLGTDPSFYGLVADVTELGKVRHLLSERAGQDTGPFPRYQEFGNDRKDEMRAQLTQASRQKLEQFYAEDYRVWR